jgi:hypothetical protein
MPKKKANLTYPVKAALPIRYPPVFSALPFPRDLPLKI